MAPIGCAMSEEHIIDRATGTSVGRIPLESCTLFQGLPATVLQKIGRLVVESEYPADATIFVEGDPATALRILASGEVELDYTLPGRPDVILCITRVSPGEMFAWSALANNATLTARARALAACCVYDIPATPLREILHDHPEAGYKVMTRLAELVASRLRDTREQLRWLQSW